jgi:DNA-binding CsgD family transcriptional regulator
MAKKNVELHEQRLRLLEAGCTDKQIAARTGSTVNAIQKWRGENQLAPNYEQGIWGKMVMDLYGQGFNDREIGERLNANQHRVFYYRKKHGLPANNRVRKHKRLYALYDRGLTDKEIAREMGWTECGVRNWRWRSGGLPTNRIRSRLNPMRWVSKQSDEARV